jgi:hypothetical protein
MEACSISTDRTNGYRNLFERIEGSEFSRLPTIVELGSSSI